jgi:vacuolar-type H+-ATPase subunit F/Vma7
MSIINKIMKNVAVFRDADGNLVAGNLATTAVITSDSKTNIEELVLAKNAEQEKAIIDAINVLKDGADGTSLSAEYDTLKKISVRLIAAHKLVDDFINGGASDDGIMNRLVELVTQINENKGTIDGLLRDKVNISDIVNDLSSGGANKVLSAEQGKALKVLIDALQENLNTQIASIHTHANKAVLDKITANHTLQASKMLTELGETWPADVRTDGVIYLVEA